jgi:leucyl aminopeptidase
MTSAPKFMPELNIVGERPKPAHDWRNSYAIALPVALGDSAVLPYSHFAKLVEREIGQSITELASDWPEITGKAGELTEIAIKHSTIKRIYLVGVGAESNEDLRKAGAALARKVKTSEKIITSALISDKSTAISHFISLILASYVWTEKTKPATAATRFLIIGNYENELKRAITLAIGVWRARDLVHTPSNVKTPLWMANQVKSWVTASKNSALAINVKSGKELAEFGGLRAVGGSSPKPGPRLIEITYAPRGSKNWPHVVLVGKGITFDTGGLSLKRPYDTMMAMKSDMSGAAIIAATTLAAAEIGAHVRITALMMCAENSVSSTSQRPSDVIKHYGGTTVEVINTDAEGRLVLADGLAYADLTLDPDYLVDVATLTGAATLSLGRQYAAMYSRDKKLAQQLSDIGESTGDRVWHMPLIDDYSSALESDIADLNHTADKGNFSAGSVTAALFLERFVGKRKWVHLDIAGPGRSETDSGENVKGGTAFGVRLLTQWLVSLK